jgi:hypothetical protein
MTAEDKSKNSELEKGPDLISARKTQVDLVRFAIIFLYKPENMTYFGEKGFLVGPYRFRLTFKFYKSMHFRFLKIEQMQDFKNHVVEPIIRNTMV